MSQTRGSRGKPLLTERELTFTSVSQGTRMCWSWHVETSGPLQACSLIVTWMGRRLARRIWSALNRLLEGSVSTSHL